MPGVTLEVEEEEVVEAEVVAGIGGRKGNRSKVQLVEDEVVVFSTHLLQTLKHLLPSWIFTRSS